MCVAARKKCAGKSRIVSIRSLVLPLYQSMVQVLPGLAEAVENIGTNRKFWRSIVDLCADRIAEDDPVRRGAASSAKRAAEADGVLASAGVRAWKSRGNMRVGDREIRIHAAENEPSDVSESGWAPRPLPPTYFRNI